MSIQSKKIIILTAPSGAGKTTIKTAMLDEMSNLLSFSVSDTTRKIRPHETEGSDYFFITEYEFKKRIDHNAFVEWEMVYPGLYYGTSIKEVERIWNEGKTPLLDIDIQGALNVKQKYGSSVLAIFIEPPSIEILHERLNKRGTESEENIQVRINKAIGEMEYKDSFDAKILNDDLSSAIKQTKSIIHDFLSAK
jgi:guanylate kinase